MNVSKTVIWTLAGAALAYVFAKTAQNLLRTPNDIPERPGVDFQALAAKDSGPQSAL